MAPKAVAFLPTSSADDAPPQGMSDLYLVAMPLDTYKALSDTAAKRGLTFAQGLERALQNWMEAPPEAPLPASLKNGKSR